MENFLYFLEILADKVFQERLLLPKTWPELLINIIFSVLAKSFFIAIDFAVTSEFRCFYCMAVKLLLSLQLTQVFYSS